MTDDSNLPTEFVHLHTHTIFSTLDGVAKPEEYMELCSKRKWPAVAITEHGTFSSIPDAYWSAKQHEIKYIVGVEFYFNDYELIRQRIQKEGKKIKELKEIGRDDLLTRIRRNRHLTVLCKNREGYKNLLRLNLYAWQNGFYYKPRIWFDQLAKHKEGLIVLSGCLNGPISHELRFENYSTKNNIIGANEYFKKFNDVFGDDFYMELQMPCIREPDLNDVEVFDRLVQLAQENGKKMVISNDSHYKSREDFEIQKIMMAIDQGMTIDSPDLFHVNSDEQYFKTRSELRKTFHEEGYSQYMANDVFEKACDNTLEVADKCENFEFDLEPKLPTINDANVKLAKEAMDGLKRKHLDKDDTLYDVDGREVTAYQQLVLELRLIFEKGYSSYFLITKDIAERVRSIYGPNGVGPGRGSAGGSLVCYVLGIVDINPLKWKLSFSRMLSPARGGTMLKVSMD